MAPPNKTDNTLPPLMECDPPVSNTASTPTSNRASVHTSVLRTTIQSSTPEPPERRRRTHSQVDPDSPVGFPFTEQRMKELLSEALAPLHKQLEEIQETQVRTIEEANYFHESLATLKSENKTLQDKLQVVEEENRNMRTRLITMESQSRRINLRFYGIPETKGENAEQLVHDFLSHNGFSYSPRAIERAHRLGPKTDKIRPIIVRFNHFKDREIIWKELGHGPIPPPYERPHVREDFAPEIEEVRAKLLPIARAAMNHKDPQTKKAPLVKLVVDKLYINNQRYTVDDLEQLPEHLKPARVYTPMTENRVAFFTKNSPLSNHYPSPFKHNSETFNCAEQFITMSKARLFGDQESVTQIMREKDPVKQKQLGKTIKNYDQTRWRACAPELITPGLLSKFEQNLVCKKVLLQTQQRLIIEANKHDMYFGAGISLRDPSIWTTDSFSGQNILGKMLTTVRGKLSKK